MQTVDTMITEKERAKIVKRLVARPTLSLRYWPCALGLKMSFKACLRLEACQVFLEGNWCCSEKTKGLQTYRFTCLLDEIGKLFKRLFVIVLTTLQLFVLGGAGLGRLSVRLQRRPIHHRRRPFRI